MSSRAAFPATYPDAASVLGTRDSRKLANNTRLVRLWGNDGIAVKLHSTNVVTFRPNGDIVLRTGGWNTLTTRDRINRVLRGNYTGQWSIGTERGTLYLYRRRINDADLREWDRFAWHDGIVVRPDDTTDAVPKPRRPYRPRVPHRAECRCAACRWLHIELRIEHNEYLTPTGVEREHIVTPEETAADATAPDGVDGDRWSNYNRKFNDLLAGRG